jgi:hypothetical protein
VGQFADAATERLRTRLATRLGGGWATETTVAGTSVDLLGRVEGRVVAVELEWRRADPVNNTAKLFRHLVSGELDADAVHVVQLLTQYYDLQSGGVRSKRANAEFVGRVAVRAVDRLSYDECTVDVDPPKRGGDRPPEWTEAVDAAVEEVAERVDGAE